MAARQADAQMKPLAAVAQTVLAAGDLGGERSELHLIEVCAALTHDE